MKLGFLILVHRYPLQAAKLIDLLLKCEDSVIIVHVDLKAPDVFSELTLRFASDKRVEFTSVRYKVFWGSYGQIQATLELIHRAHDVNVDYACLLSGQDMPVKKLSELRQFFIDKRGKQFLVNFRLPDKQWDSGGLDRLQLFHFDIEGHPWFSNKLNTLVGKIQKTLGLKRKIKFNLHGGSNWFNLSSQALEYIVKYVGENPSYLSSFKYSRTADEIFIQTILLNSPLKDSVVSDDLRYIDWATGPEYPRILREDDFDKMITAKDRFFGRKFDANIDAGIIEKLNNYVSS